mmetsp:Transcript_37160/g.102231  ORF Transcript_37160/g.102231 Transcript_37160/m.102231 type:complete len:220 (-) Transcript_37160:811-1470(-)
MHSLRSSTTPWPPAGRALWGDPSWRQNCTAQHSCARACSPASRAPRAREHQMPRRAGTPSSGPQVPRPRTSGHRLASSRCHRGRTRHDSCGRSRASSTAGRRDRGAVEYSPTGGPSLGWPRPPAPAACQCRHRCSSVRPRPPGSAAGGTPRPAAVARSPCRAPGVTARPRREPPSPRCAVACPHVHEGSRPNWQASSSGCNRAWSSASGSPPAGAAPTR